MDYILFDLDGTLTDPKEGITKSLKYALESFGIDVPEIDALAKYIGPPLRTTFREYFEDEQAEAAVVKFREYYAEHGLYENKLYPGVPELLRGLLKNGKTLALATSKVAVYAQKILKYFNIAEYFAFVSGDEMNGSRSDKPALIQHVFDNVRGISPENSVMVGDRRHDILGAKAAGIRSIGVLYGYGSRDELETAGADFFAADTREIYTIISNIN